MSESDKAARRAAILDAAEQQLRKVGFEAFSMEVLARSLGIARGTLYRYFETREEVLLELYLSQRARFAAALTGAIRPGISDADFVEQWYRHATSDALFLTLQARLGSVIEHNISPERVIEAKQVMQRDLEEVVGYVAECLALDAARARRLIVALVAVLLGATEIDNSPRLTNLPPEIRTTMDAFSARTVFTDAARLILEGLKRESA